jgi:uncharacterized protein
MENKPLDYTQLLLRLVKDFVWPTEYMFKFIVPFDAKSLNEVKELFSKEAKINHRESSGGKYVSVTAIQLMDNPDEVIAIYQKAEKIDKIIAL